MKNIYTCFPGGKHKALTMSYDDGKKEDYQLLEIFNRYGIKGTFHLNSGLCDEGNGGSRLLPNEWRKAYEGHEISCHTALHPQILRCPIEQVAIQILKDREALEKEVGYPIRGMSYPYGACSEEIMKLLPLIGIEYSRITGDSDAFEMPKDFLKWKGTCHHNHNLLENGRRFLELYKTQHLYLMYVWGHSYEFPMDDNWEMMEEFCKMMSGRDDIWYATNIQIVDYMKAAKNLKFSIAGDIVYNPMACSVWIEVDGAKLEVPGGSTVTL